MASREFLDADLQMAVGGRALAGAGDGDLDGLGDSVSRADGDDGRVVERREGLRRNAIGGHAALAEPLVAAADGLDRHAGSARRPDAGAAGGGAEPSCRPRSRLSGVNRHSSSRPPGTSKASTSNEANCSPLFLRIPRQASL